MKVKRRKVKRYRNFASNGSETTNAASMPASQYVMGLIGVGVLFFVIGYGWEKGKLKA